MPRRNPDRLPRYPHAYRYQPQRVLRCASASLRP